MTLVAGLAAVASPLLAQQLPEAWAEDLHWRSIGPSTMGGRIISLAVYEAEPSTWWAATASGGLLKTTNNGTTFEHQFDQESVVSIGHVAVSQSNKDVVWVGTGEANPRNSVSYGNGVYKSTDGGKTWTHMGLAKTFQTGRIAIHPTNPDVVYVGALGRLYGPNEDRGLYKTTDGGETWSKVLYVDDQTGVIDVDMHPTEPDTLMVATYERARDGFDTNDPAKRWGPGGGVWKTTDGGANWMRIKTGLPSCQIGRVGIDYYRKDPNVLMAIVESEMISKQPEDAPYHGAQLADADAGVKVSSVEAARRGGRGRGRAAQQEAGEAPAKPAPTPAAKAGLKTGDVILAVAGQRVNSREQLERACRQHKAGDEVALSIVRDREDMEVMLTFGAYPDGARSPFIGTLGGQSGGSPDLQGDAGHEYGGVYKSTDGGDTWTRINTLNPRPMYYSQIRIDPSNSDNVMVLGTSLYRSTDGGKSFDRGAGNGMHVDHHAEWIDPNNGDHIIHGCDGGVYVTYDAGRNWDHLNHVAIGQFYHVGVSSDRNYRVYGGLQDNGSWGGPSRTSGTGARNHDWVRVGGGDGFRCLVDPDNRDVVYSQSQNGPPSWRNLSTSERGSLRGGGGRGERVRYNWETPYVLSGHNSKIVYTAGNKVFKSLNRGRNMEAISPDITNTDRGAATALAESPRDDDIVYVGTDDGALWATHDGGATWFDCFEEDSAEESQEGDPPIGEPQAGGPSVTALATARPIHELVPGPRWVSELVASAHDSKRAYVTLDGHRSDDDAPYAMITEDGGKTWRSLTESLPAGAGSTRTIAEDPVNEDLLFLGTEFQAFVSLDRGAHWTRFNGDLPTVSVHAFAVNVPSGEIVAGTHGRSLWITSVNELRQMTADVLDKAVHFYEPVSAVIWRGDLGTGDTNRRFVAENPKDGAHFVYHLKEDARDVSLELLDSTGKSVRKMDAPKEQGLHRVTWNLRGPVNLPAGASERQRQWMMRRGGPRVGPGSYTARLTVDGEEMLQRVKVEIDPDHPDPSWIANQEAAEWLEFLEEVERDEAERSGR
ncbi:MAG: VPS10 domain-containing protein [Planctomycetota bacterium]